MGAVINLFDRLTNIMSGKGTTADRSVWSAYAFVPVSPQQAEAAYRSSWLVRKIIDIPPFDMTREWREWQTDAATIEKLEAEECRLQLRVKCQRAMVLARLFGGGALVIGTNDGDSTQPLNSATIKAGGLTYLHVMSRHQLSEGGRQRLDPADPWFGQPEYFMITQSAGRAQIRLHPSRVIAFVGQRAPEGSFLSGASWFWGDPIMQSIGQAVKNADLAQDGFAALIDEAKIDIVKMPDLMAQAANPEYGSRLLTRLAAASTGKSTWRMLALDAQEEWQQRQITWTGMPDMMTAFLNAVAGAADIPLTRLLGVSPKGLQSNGDGEARDYQAMVRTRQHELLSPALDHIDDLLIRSALGSRPSDIYYEFAPLAQMDEKDAAAIEKQRAETVKLYADTGVIPDAALSAMAKNGLIESGRWPGSEAAFEEAETEPLPGEQGNPDPLTTLTQRIAAMEQRGQITQADAARLIADAQPRSLYVSRQLLNAADVIAWAKGQGFETTVPAGQMHVTILYSRQPVDWMSLGAAWEQDDKGQLRVAPGGPRMLDRFGSFEDAAVVLLFNSSALSWRHEQMKQQGASSDYPDFAPHVTLSYSAAGVDLSKIEPYQGELIFGPEMFSEIDEDWKSGISEE